MTDDTISRQAAIDALNRCTEIYLNNLPPTIYKTDAVEAVTALPPAQQWIPCNEKLPEGDERVLVTTAWGEVTIAERVYPPIADICWFIHDGNTNATSDDVVAWKPLPESYKWEKE